MTKMKSNCTWSQLTPEQRGELERWLFNENMSYRAVVERVLNTWGIASTPWSVQRFYHRCASERTLKEMTECHDTAGEVNGAEAKSEGMRTASWKVLNARVLDKLMATDDLKDLATLCRLLSESEWAEIQNGRLGLARERLGLKAAEARLPKLRQIKCGEALQTSQQVIAVKENLFGEELPQ